MNGSRCGQWRQMRPVWRRSILQPTAVCEICCEDPSAGVHVRVQVSSMVFVAQFVVSAFMGAVMDRAGSTQRK